MAQLTTDQRNRLKSSTFALPGRRFPVPDASHARNALARATQGVKAGTLSPAEAAVVRRKANAKLGNPGVTQDLNAPGNRSPQTPLQEDINNWKSKPVTTRGKWQMNSQGSGRADQPGDGKSFKGQEKFGGTVAPSGSKKGQVKTGGTVAPGKTYKGMEKLGGTGMGNGGGKRYANGSSSHDNMRTMVRDH